jgi:hypothetical protein
MINLIGGAVVNMVALTAVDRGFKPQSGQTKDYKIGTYAILFKNVRRNRDIFSLALSNIE